MNERPRVKTSIIKMNLYVLKYVFKFCPLYIVFALLAVAASVVVSLSEVKLIADTISLITLGSGDINLLFNNLFKYVIIIGICYLFRVFYNTCIVPRYRIIYRKKMQTFLFSKVKHIDMESYDNPEFYDKFSRALGDSTWRGIAVFNTFVEFIEAVSVSLALGTYVLITDYVLILIVLVSAVINVFVINFRNKVWYQVFREAERSRRYQYYVRRTFYQQRFAAEIKTTPIDSLLIDKFEDATYDIEKIYRKAEKRLLLPYAVSTFTENLIQQSLSYIYLAYRLFNGLAISVFTATVNATFRFSNNFARAINVYTNLREHSYYINDFLWIVDYKPSIEKNIGKEASSFESLKIDDISFMYPLAHKNSLNHISIDIKKGEKIALVGDNGGGKTTLVKQLLRFYSPSSGTIYYNGVELDKYNEASIRKQYSIVYQDFQIYALSVAENVLLRKVESKEDERIVESALEKVGLLEKVKSFKDGIYTKVTREFDREGATFSGGENQRLVISRVFASNASMYILDEPTSALDPLSEEKINKLIINSTDKTMIIIAHRLSTVVDADRIYLIRGGSIVEKGTHEELMQMKGSYFEMFETQTELYLKKKAN